MVKLRNFICVVQTDGVGLRRTIHKTGLKTVRAPTLSDAGFTETPAEVAAYLMGVIQANDLIPIDDLSVSSATLETDIEDNLTTFIEDYDPDGGKNQFKAYLVKYTGTNLVGVAAHLNVIQYSNGEDVGLGMIELDEATIPVLDVNWDGVPTEANATEEETFTMPVEEYPEFTSGTVSNTTWTSSVTVDGVELFPGERKPFNFAYTVPAGSAGQDLVFTAYAENLIGEDSVSVTFVIQAGIPA